MDNEREANLRIGADFKGMELHAMEEGEDGLVYIEMDERRGWIYIDKDDATAIIMHLAEQFDLEDLV